jgi:hypothetical protein
MVWQCLERQTMQDFEWIVTAPDGKIRLGQPRDNIKLLVDPPKRDGDFYCLNKAWNAAVGHATGDLLVFAVDWIWFNPDALERFWNTYVDDPLAVVSSYGHHFRRVDKVTGRPEVLWQFDQRPAVPGFKMPWFGFEAAFASVPRSKFLEVGGFDEKYDRVPGNSEKDFAGRLMNAGCKVLLSPYIECRNFTHSKEGDYPRNWDEAYKESQEMFKADFKEIEVGRRKVVSNA